MLCSPAFRAGNNGAAADREIERWADAESAMSPPQFPQRWSTLLMWPLTTGVSIGPENVVHNVQGARSAAEFEGYAFSRGTAAAFVK